VPQASAELHFPLPPPDPPLQARDPTERYDAASQKNARPRDCLAMIRSRSRQHSLVRQLPGCGSPLGDDEGRR